MDSNYAQIHQKLTYNSPDDFSRDREQLGEAPGDPYAVAEDHYTKIAMKQWKGCPSKVAKEYFSVTNIKRIQKEIRREIYNRYYTKFILTEDQNVHDLLQAMIIVYEQNGRNLPHKIVRQVKVLNKQIVQYVSPDIKTNIEQHYGYLNDIKNPITPISAPLNVNHIGRRQLSGTAQHYNI